MTYRDPLSKENSQTILNLNVTQIKVILMFLRMHKQFFLVRFVRGVARPKWKHLPILSWKDWTDEIIYFPMSLCVQNLDLLWVFCVGRFGDPTSLFIPLGKGLPTLRLEDWNPTFLRWAKFSYFDVGVFDVRLLSCRRLLMCLVESCWWQWY